MTIYRGLKIEQESTTMLQKKQIILRYHVLVPPQTSTLSLNNDSQKSPRKFVSPGSFFIYFLFLARVLDWFRTNLEFFEKEIGRAACGQNGWTNDQVGWDDHMVSKDNTNYSEILQIKKELNWDSAGLFQQNLGLIQKRVSKSQLNSIWIIKISR